MSTLLVNTGKAVVTNYLNGGAATQPKYVAWGTGAGTTAATDTTLFTETGSRVSGTTTQANYLYNKRYIPSCWYFDCWWFFDNYECWYI